jgi:tRNA threonylcarbamoyladenosine biosynthesis protein TsaE
MIEFFLKDEAATFALGERLASVIDHVSVLYLSGDLGAGKTTFARGLILGMGHRGFVKSPTFTIVEPYLDTKKPVYHFDLYRLNDPEALEYLGFRDYLDKKHLCVFEWPDLGGSYVPAPDLSIHFAFEAQGRVAQCVAGSEQGLRACEYLQKQVSK